MSSSGHKQIPRIGILFNFSPQWMGGVVYILNLIKTLDFLDYSEKPEIILFYRPDLRKYVNEIKYQKLKAIEWSFPTVYFGYLESLLLNKNVFVSEIFQRFDLDALYPVHDFPVKTNTKTKLLSWYADLQHNYYPEFFSTLKILERNSRIRFMLRNSDDLVISSRTVENDFLRFYKVRKSMKMHVYHFVSVVDDLSGLQIEEVLKKYNLPEKYFIVSNQFHKHKNHKVILKALSRLKKRKPEIHLLITGRLPEAARSNYMKELNEIINTNSLQANIFFMGIIPRAEQLLLMQHAQAVIQPSLFEGWSTVIEDAISLNVPVLASSIAVNHEQLGQNGIYFEPQDDEELAGLLDNFPVRVPHKILYDDYNRRVREAARTFMRIILK